MLSVTYFTSHTDSPGKGTGLGLLSNAAEFLNDERTGDSLHKPSQRRIKARTGAEVETENVRGSPVKPTLAFGGVKPPDLTSGFYKSAMFIPSFLKSTNCVPTVVPRTGNAVMNKAVSLSWVSVQSSRREAVSEFPPHEEGRGRTAWRL